MFGPMLLAVAALLHAYVFWRAGSIPSIGHRLTRGWLIALAACLWALLALGRTFHDQEPRWLFGSLELAGLNWLAALFLAAVALLAVELLAAVRLVPRSAAPKARGAALLAGAALAVAAMVQGTRAPVVTHHEVTLHGLPPELDGTVVVGLSDLHIGRQVGAAWLDERVSQVERLRPDLVVLLGDILEGRGVHDPKVREALSRLSAPLGVWAVAGNHERHDRRGAAMALIQSAGIGVLHNRSVELRPGLVLSGVEDLTTHKRSGRHDSPIAEALAARPAGATILLSHTPARLDEAAQAGVGLTLSGHTHGGQVWPFGLLVHLVHPVPAGRSQVQGMTLLVSRGAGTWGPRMRLWAPGEILRIVLRAPPPTLPPR